MPQEGRPHLSATSCATAHVYIHMFIPQHTRMYLTATHTCNNLHLQRCMKQGNVWVRLLQWRAYAHTHTRTLSLSLSLSLSRTHTPAPSIASISYPHAYTHTHAHTQTHTLSFSLSLTLAHQHTGSEATFECDFYSGVRVGRAGARRCGDSSGLVVMG